MVLLSAVFIYFILELSFPYVLARLPLKNHRFLDKGTQILAQYSKKSTVPKNYIAIVGGSYVAGKGDWFSRIYKNKKGVPQDVYSAYSSAHIIHERTGRDVITFDDRKLPFYG